MEQIAQCNRLKEGLKQYSARLRNKGGFLKHNYNLLSRGYIAQFTPHLLQVLCADG